MKFMKILPAVLLLVLAGCNKTGKEVGSMELPRDFDYGKVEGHTYSNPYFGLKMEFPEDWKVQSRKVVEDMVEMGKSEMDNGDPTVKRAMKAADITTAYLFTAFKYELGTTEVDFNPSVTIYAENISRAPQVNTGELYLDQAKMLIKRSAAKITLADDYEKRTIGGKEFYILKGKLDQDGFIIDQAYYATVIDGFALAGILSYAGEEQEKEMVAVLEGMKFGK